MKIVSWNVNGIRSVIAKSKDGTRNQSNQSNQSQDNVLKCLICEVAPDVICLQELKCSDEHTSILDQYKNTHPYIYTHCASNTRGYSGVALMSNFAAIQVVKTGGPEGRIIAAEFDKFIVVSCYTPNSKRQLERLDERINKWEPMFREFITTLATKTIIIMGDLNVVRSIQDIYKPKPSSPCCTIEEQNAFQTLLIECELTDTFRALNPTARAYTYFSNFANSRAKNNGWRLDYALVSNCLVDRVTASTILSDYYGSDHVPIMIELNV